MKKIMGLWLCVFSVPLFCAGAFAQQKKSLPIEVFDPVKEILGMSEDEFKQLPADQRAAILTQKNVGAGTFYTHRVGFTKNMLPEGQRKNIKFNIIEDLNGLNSNASIKDFGNFVDVAAIQANPENNGAVIQVASRFNCHEGRGSVAACLNCKVQGEQATASAAAGLFHRLYNSQCSDDKRNLLKDIRVRNKSYSDMFPYYNIKDGGLSGWGIGDFSSMTEEDRLQLVESMHVGVQENVTVTSGRIEENFSGGLIQAQRPLVRQQVTQVLVSTVNGPQPSQEQLTRALLCAAYQGTLEVACDKGAKNVFLTCVGGGVFNNPFPWIADAIVKAYETVAKRADVPEGMQVNLVLFNTSGSYAKHDSSYAKHIMDCKWEDAYVKLLDLMHRSGGHKITNINRVKEEERLQEVASSGKHVNPDHIFAHMDIASGLVDFEKSKDVKEQVDAKLVDFEKSKDVKEQVDAKQNLRGAVMVVQCKIAERFCLYGHEVSQDDCGACQNMSKCKAFFEPGKPGHTTLLKAQKVLASI